MTTELLAKVAKLEAENASLRESYESLRAADRDEGDYAPRGEGAGGGWVRVGRYDPPRRRSLWVRICGDEEITGIELCAGREGDDAYVKILPDAVGFNDLLDCLSRAIDVAEGNITVRVAGVLTIGSTP